MHCINNIMHFDMRIKQLWSKLKVLLLKWFLLKKDWDVKVSSYPILISEIIFI